MNTYLTPMTTPNAPSTAGEASERKPPVRQPDDFETRHVYPDWRREPTAEFDPRKGR